MAAKFFTGLPLDGPDPECVKGNADAALLGVSAGTAPKPSADHSRARSRPVPVPVSIGLRPVQRAAPERACDENPLAGFAPSPAG
jgi:hypothetical protein